MRIDPTLLIDSGFVDPKLARVLKYIEAETGLDFMSTSLYRPDEKSSVHGVIPLRGWDLRCYDPVIGERVCHLVNKRWKYDYKRPGMACAIYHEVNGNGAHIHVQVHPNTRAL